MLGGQSGDAPPPQPFTAARSAGGKAGRFQPQSPAPAPPSAGCEDRKRLGNVHVEEAGGKDRWWEEERCWSEGARSHSQQEVHSGSPYSCCCQAD